MSEVVKFTPCIRKFHAEALMKTTERLTSLALASVAILFAGGAVPAYAVTHNSSSSVVVLNNNGTPSGGVSAGVFPTSAITGAGYSVTFKAASTVNSLADLGGADTVVFWEFCTIGSYGNTQNAIISFLQNGGKLIIWDSDACSSPNYSFLSAVGAQFTISSPGQTGSSGGSLTINENNDFLLGPPAITAADLNTLVTSSDAVGDLNVIASSSPSWCATLTGTNIRGGTGFADAYTAPSSLTGAPSGMIVWDGLDTNFIGYPTPGPIMTQMILNQLAHGWGPVGSPQVADLACGVTLTGISLSPATSTNPVGGSHTVAAFVYTIPGITPIAGATVHFAVSSGPNAGASGSAVTDGTGHASFTYSDSGGAGTDTIVATFTDAQSVVHTSNTAYKTWGAVGAPEFGAPAAFMAAVALLAVSLLSKRMRPSGIATRL